jgi:hypothetical protein
MSYSVLVLKKAAFEDEVENVLNSQTMQLKMGTLAHGIVLQYFSSRIKEFEEKTEEKTKENNSV